MISPVQRLAPSFPIPRPSLAALEDQARLGASVAEIRRLRAMTAAALRQDGWHVGESQGNFILVRPGARPEADVAEAVRRLAEAHILVRPLASIGGAPAFRMTIGREEHMQRVMAVLKR